MNAKHERHSYRIQPPSFMVRMWLEDIFSPSHVRQPAFDTKDPETPVAPNDRRFSLSARRLRD